MQTNKHSFIQHKQDSTLPPYLVVYIIHYIKYYSLNIRLYIIVKVNINKLVINYDHKSAASGIC